MEAYQQRVLVEKEELNEKIKKLQSFTEADDFKEKVKNPFERTDLQVQLNIMRNYYNILQKRSNRF